jgi:hypothetical protein
MRLLGRELSLGQCAQKEMHEKYLEKENKNEQEKCLDRRFRGTDLDGFVVAICGSGEGRGERSAFAGKRSGEDRQLCFWSANSHSACGSDGDVDEQ